MSDQNESLSVNAKTIDEAIESGLNQLGLSRDQVEIEIISEGKRGLFGLGSEEALVRLTPLAKAEDSRPPVEIATPAEETPADRDQLASVIVDRSGPEPVDTGAGPVETGDDSPDVAPEARQEVADETKGTSLEEIGTAYLGDLLDRMGVEAQISTRTATDLVEPGEDPPLVFDVSGKDLGILIGRRNETLQALQFMLRLMVSKEMGRWQSLIVDVESYRARRRESLRNMANRMADRAVANQERVVLEAMPAYERRIVHIALRDNPAVTTKSIGHDKNRKVTITPT